MPAKEIKALREAGKSNEAHELALVELQAQPDSIWPKRNISWVYYDYLKKNIEENNLNEFLNWIGKITDLQLPVDEHLFYDKLSWQIGRMGFNLNHEEHPDIDKFMRLFNAIKDFPLVKKTEGYSFLLKPFLKGLKHNYHFLEFADWWGFENFRDEDYKKETMPNGKETMALVEQGYIAYAKLLLPERLPTGEANFNRDKVELFMPKLDVIIESHPEFEYPAYFKAKLLLAMGDSENMLFALLPFAKKKKNNFWVWEILSEAFINDLEKVFACYCKALSCNSPEVMLVGLRQRMASLLVKKKLYTEAKTEIELLVSARIAKGYKIPYEVAYWQNESWYKDAIAKKSNAELYKQHFNLAEELLFADEPEETVIIEFVNTDKKIANFIASEDKTGFFKYDRYLKNVNIGDTLKIRFQSGSNGGLYKVFTMSKYNDENFKQLYYKDVEGGVKVQDGKAFGFLDDIYIHPSMISKSKLSNGMMLKGKAMKTFNKEKKKWGWKLIELIS